MWHRKLAQDDLEDRRLSTAEGSLTDSSSKPRESKKGETQVVGDYKGQWSPNLIFELLFWADAVWRSLQMQLSAGCCTLPQTLLLSFTFSIFLQFCLNQALKTLANRIASNFSTAIVPEYSTEAALKIHSSGRRRTVSALIVTACGLQGRNSNYQNKKTSTLPQTSIPKCWADQWFSHRLVKKPATGQKWNYCHKSSVLLILPG